MQLDMLNLQDEEAKVQALEGLDSSASQQFENNMCYFPQQESKELGSLGPTELHTEPNEESKLEEEQSTSLNDDTSSDPIMFSTHDRLVNSNKFFEGLKKRFEKKRVRLAMLQKFVMLLAIAAVVLLIWGILDDHSILVSLMMALWQCYLARCFFIIPVAELAERHMSFIKTNVALLVLPAFSGVSSCLIADYYCSPSEIDNSKIFYSEGTFWLILGQIGCLYLLEKTVNDIS